MLMQPGLILVLKLIGFVFPQTEPQKMSEVLGVLQPTCMLWREHPTFYSSDSKASIQVSTTMS